MPVPNRPIYIKKLAGGVAYYSTPPGPKVTITQSATGSCNFAGASSGCTAVSTMSLLNPDAAVLTDIVWAVSPPGVLSGANGLTSIQINVTSDENVTAAVTCTLKIDGVDTVLTGEVDSTHNDISEQLVITSINRDSGGSCEYPAGDTCVSSSVFSVTTSGGSGTKSYEWSVNGSVSFVGARNTPTVEIETIESDTDITYTVSCEITDRKFVAFKNEEFTDVRTEEVVGIIKQNVVSFLVNNTFGNKTVAITLPTGENRAIVACISKTASATGNTLNYGCTIGGQTHSLTQVTHDATYAYYTVHFVFLEDKIAAMTNNNATFTFSGSGQSASASNAYSATVHCCSGVSSAAQFASLTATGVVAGDALITSAGFNGNITWTNINGVLNSTMDVGDNFTAGNTANSVVSPVVSGSVTTGTGGTYPVTTRLIAVIP